MVREDKVGIVIEQGTKVVGAPHQHIIHTLVVLYLELGQPQVLNRREISTFLGPVDLLLLRRLTVDINGQ